MRVKLSDLLALAALAAFGCLWAWAPAGAGWLPDLNKALIGGLTVYCFWRVNNRAGRDETRGEVYLIDTACHLNLESLSAPDFENETAELIGGLANSGPRPTTELKPLALKIEQRLRRFSARYPLDAAAQGWRAWNLALLSRIEGWEKGRALGVELAEDSRWEAANTRYQSARELAPDDGRLAADWARALEGRAVVASPLGPHLAERCLKMALKEYERAVELDEEFKPAWRGRGRVLVTLVMEFEAQPGLDMLKTAVDCYEKARGDWDWDGDFYEEFGQAVFNLAQRHPVQAVHFFRYAARLFIMSAEMNGGASLPLFQAGRALHQAGHITQETSAERAELLFKESLDYFKEAAETQPDNPWARLWSARCLTSLYQLPLDESEAESLEDREDLLVAAARLCADAAALAKDEEIFSEWANVLSLRAELDGEEAPELWAETARRYASAVSIANVPSERAAVNWHNWGYALVSLSEYKPAESRGRLLHQAALKYERAAGLNGDNPVTLKNWGDALGDLAELCDDPAEAAHLTGEAIDKFRRAAELYPDDAGPWRRWSSIVQGLARAEHNPSRRRDLWQEAIDRLESGVKANAADPATWVMWGQVLSELYWEGPEYERPILIEAISEKYEKALELEPASETTWGLLGRVHLEASELPEEFATSMEGGPLGHVASAVNCFKRACHLKPHLDEYWAEWGRSLFRLAQKTENEASALGALSEAHDKYLTASALSPECADHHTGLGHILYQWAWRLEEPEDRRAKFAEAYVHCTEAGRLAPHDHIVWRNWGKVAEALANMEKDPLKSFDWQNEAEEKYYQADVLEPTGERGRRH